MPGFRIDSVGANSKFSKAEFRRAHRWRVTSGGTLSRESWLYLQKCSRPSFKYDEVKVHHDQEVAYFAGKQTWEPITFSFYDVEDAQGQVKDVSDSIYKWIAGGAVGGAGGAKPVGDHSVATVNAPIEYKKDLTLQLTDGKGNVTEEWKLKGAWPIEVKWSDLTYEDSKVIIIDVKIRFDRAKKTI